MKNAISLKELTKKCEKITSNSIKFTVKKSTSIYDIPYFVTDNSKVSNLYKWKPEKNIDDIIRDTHLWMKLNLNKLKAYIKWALYFVYFAKVKGSPRKSKDGNEIAKMQY